MANESEQLQWPALFVSLVVTFAAAAVGSQFAPDDWYRNLQKPAFNPPDAVFAPVWTTLYLLMAVAAWLIWRQRHYRNVAPALVAYLVQLLLNASWSWLFFGRHWIGIALVDLIMLWAAILLTMILFWRISRWAGVLLVPYLAWVSFAGVLNFRFWQFNG